MKLTDSDNDKKWEEQGEEEDNILQKTVTTKILLAVIAVLLILILVLLTVVVSSRQNRQDGKDSDLQQTITDYAKQQQEMEEQVISEEEKKPAADLPASEEPEEKVEEEEEPEEEEEAVSADNEKTAIVVDIEDENDEAYTKEFILKEAYPYFAENKQDAIWDLAHLKRYVKLSKGLRAPATTITRAMWTATGSRTVQDLPSMKRTATISGNGATGRETAKAHGSGFTSTRKIKIMPWGYICPTSTPGNGREICQTARGRSTTT